MIQLRPQAGTKTAMSGKARVKLEVLFIAATVGGGIDVGADAGVCTVAPRHS